MTRSPIPLYALAASLTHIFHRIFQAYQQIQRGPTLFVANGGVRPCTQQDLHQRRIHILGLEMTVGRKMKRGVHLVVDNGADIPILEEAAHAGLFHKCT